MLDLGTSRNKLLGHGYSKQPNPEISASVDPKLSCILNKQTEKLATVGSGCHIISIKYINVDSYLLAA